MKRNQDSRSRREFSRRRFITSAGLAATAVCLAPHRVFGAEENLVIASRKAGETANITVQACSRPFATALLLLKEKAKHLMKQSEPSVLLPMTPSGESFSLTVNSLRSRLQRR